MTKRKRPTYTDDFRASCVLMLEAAGYEKTPTKALEAVSKSQRVPESTLRSWWNRLHKTGQLPSTGTVPAKIYDIKKKDLRQAIRDEIYAALNEMDDKRIDAQYRDLAWATGVLFDKLQLLDDKPTAIVKLQEALENGRITREEIATRYPSLAQQFFAHVD